MRRLQARPLRESLRAASTQSVQPKPTVQPYEPRRRNRQRSRSTVQTASRVNAIAVSPGLWSSLRAAPAQVIRPMPTGKVAVGQNAPGQALHSFRHRTLGQAHQCRPRFCLRFARGFPPSAAPDAAASAGPETPRSCPGPGADDNTGAAPAEPEPSFDFRELRGAARNSLMFCSVMSQRLPARPALNRPSFSQR